MARRCLVIVLAMVLVLVGSPTPGMAEGAKKLIVNHFVSRPDVLAYLYVTDVEGLGPAVTVSFFTMEGELIKKKSTLVPIYGTEWIEIYPLVSKICEGNILIESGGGAIAGEYWHLGYRNSDAKERFSLALPAQDATGSKSIAVQHYVSDNSLNATVYVADAGSGSGPGTVIHLEFYDESSNLLLKSRHLVPPHGTAAISPWNFLTPKKTVGTLYITSTGGPITGEYWQIVNQKIDDPKQQKTEGVDRIWYSVAVPAITTSKVVAGQ